MQGGPERTGRATEASSTAQILLVDDDRGALGMLGDVLRAEGFRPTTTADPREALALLAMERFDLVIIDIVMPHLDGFGLLEKARERNPGAEVLLISGFATDELVREARQKGAAGVLQKPFDITTFTARVRALLARPSQP
jgi:two-component system response regulator GlrR